MHFTSVRGALYDKRMSDLIFDPVKDVPQQSSFGSTLFIVGIFIVLAALIGLFPVIFFIVQWSRKGFNGAFQDYMEYKYTEAVLNNANMNHDEHKK
jgi:hypothetical protein